MKNKIKKHRNKYLYSVNSVIFNFMFYNLLTLNIVFYKKKNNT